MKECDDCGEQVTVVEEYDDTFEDPESPGGYSKGYFHGWMLCIKCTEKQDFKTARMYEELAEERHAIWLEGRREL
jgi:hypothetical protein